MKQTYALAVLLASGFALNAQAQTPSAPPPSAPAPASAAAVPAIAPIPAKVAIIAFQVAVAQTNEGQRNFSDLQKKFDPKRQQIKTQQDEIENLKKQLQAQGDKLSAAEQASRTKAIEDKTKLLQRTGEDAQNDFQTEMQDMYNTLASKVIETVDSYAKDQGFTLVLDASAQQSPILWASEATNITPQVIAAYNTKSGVPAPPPAPAGSAPASAPRAPAARKPATSTPAPK